MKLAKNYDENKNFISVVVECENSGEAAILHQAIEEFTRNTKDKKLKKRSGDMLAKLQNREA